MNIQRRGGSYTSVLLKVLFIIVIINILLTIEVHGFSVNMSEMAKQATSHI